jgi:NUMOD1 domain-containing protein
MLINKAILKYGRVNFSLEILEYCSNKDLIKREQYYLDLLKPEYNILKLAGSSYGYKHNEVSLIKFRTRVVREETLSKMKARIQSENTKIKISKALGIPVIVTDIDKENVIQYFSKSQAAKIIGVSESTIRRYIISKKLLFNRYSIVEIIKSKKKRKVPLLV